MASWTSPITNRTIATHPSYGTTDLNRVEENSEYLSNLLNSMNYTQSVITDYTWLRTEWFALSDATQYLLNISTIRSVLTLPITTPTVPSSLDDLTFTIANDIEKIQLDVYELANAIVYESNLKRAGTFGAVAGADIGLI